MALTHTALFRSSLALRPRCFARVGIGKARERSRFTATFRKVFIPTVRQRLSRITARVSLLSTRRSAISPEPSFAFNAPGTDCERGLVHRLDLNQRPSGYEPDELPGCSTVQQTPLASLSWRLRGPWGRFVFVIPEHTGRARMAIDGLRRSLVRCKKKPPVPFLEATGGLKIAPVAHPRYTPYSHNLPRSRGTGNEEK